MRSYDRALPIALLRAREATLRPFRAHLDAHGLTVQQWRVIRALAEGAALTPTELAERCVLLPPSLSRILRAMTDRGLVEPAADQDARRRRVRLTTEGRALYDSAAVQSRAVYDRIETVFGAGRMETLLDLLVDLQDVVEADPVLAKNGIDGGDDIT
ncbi:homoprotocatechuate degradation operon regulator HpaR [Anianabacter salinae]|uniref:homoprotocatechuate degradation operon regulator HpaR n=1 Tax=Anianabacter salinae TaxID=2851023 RepID=UPI00225DD6CF|nr:homoprotocatechuate degradation operon regulator HpaR [Anianabacter salinae]MBV0911781.1 homoprotocatechuate degradation operon regulator HpaR [Anianabacter salinae]